jgi:hypothetical protein
MDTSGIFTEPALYFLAKRSAAETSSREGRVVEGAKMEPEA